MSESGIAHTKHITQMAWLGIGHWLVYQIDGMSISVGQVKSEVEVKVEVEVECKNEPA